MLGKLLWKSLNVKLLYEEAVYPIFYCYTAAANIGEGRWTSLHSVHLVLWIRKLDDKYRSSYGVFMKRAAEKSINANIQSPDKTMFFFLFYQHISGV